MRRARAWLGLLMVLALGACTQERVNESEIGVRYGHGPIEGDHFEHLVMPGDYEWVGDDEVIRLPARQVTWTSGPGGDAEALQFNAKGGELMVMELSTRFFLNTTVDDEEEPFRTFFNDICRKHECWDGATSRGEEGDGWSRMLFDIVGQPQQAAANIVGLDYEAEELRYDTAVRDDFADAFAAEFETLLEREVGVANIFCGGGYEQGDESCPPVGVQVTNVRFADAAREGVREAQRLAEEREQLAVQEAETAAAQQQVNEQRATLEWERLKRGEAMVACAENPECQLTIIVTGDGTEAEVTVPAR